MVTDGSYACGECGIMYRLAQSLCCIPETSFMLCVNSTSVFKTLKSFKTFKKKRKETQRLNIAGRL